MTDNQKIIQKRISDIKKIQENIEEIEKIKKECIYAKESVFYYLYKTIGEIYNNIKPIQVYYKDDNTPFFLYEKRQTFELFNLLNLPEQTYYSKEDSWEESWNEQSSWEESMKEFL
jgi:hypothetical protein